MYLFLLYLVVHFVNEVDLWDPTDYQVHDRAAETAKFIDIVQKTDNFEVKYPLKSNNRDDGRNKDKIADDLDVFETMKLLQKNYDVNRKFNEIPKQARLQYISNPEVLETYKNLGNSRQDTEVYDDIDNQDGSIRSYLKELSELRYFRTNDKNITEAESVKGDNNDAAEETKTLNKRRHIREEQNSEDNGNLSETWSGNSEEVHEHSVTFNLVKPIVAEMLAKYAIKASQEESTEMKNNEDLTTSAKKENSKIENVHIESEKSDEGTQTEGAETNLDFKHLKKQKKDAISKKVTGSFISDEQKKKNKSNNDLVTFEISKFFTENGSKDDRDVPNKSISPKKENIDPTVTIEDNTSEEIKNDANNKKSNSRMSIKQADNEDKEHVGKIKSKPKKNKSEKENESDNGDTRVAMEEKVIDWADYDEKKKTSEHDSEIDNENSNKNTNKEKLREKLKKNIHKHINNENKKIVTNIENENENNEHNDDSRYKIKVSTKRKGDWNEKNDNWDKNYDDGNKDDNISSKKLSSFNKKEDLKQKNNWNKKDDFDLNNKNDKSNKQKHMWNKQDIDWNKKEDDWNRKEDEVYVKEENKKVKKKDWNNNDDDGNNNLKTAGNLKRDSAWDNVGNNKNSGWGSYDSFKNILEKKNTNLKDNISQAEISKPKTDFTAPKHSSWDNYSPKRDDYYDKPKRQGRMTMYRTPIPIVGKRPLYAD